MAGTGRLIGGWRNVDINGYCTALLLVLSLLMLGEPVVSMCGL